MAINKVMRAALKALSYPDMDIKRTYRLQRKVINLTHYHFMKPFYRTWDHAVTNGDHDVPVRIFLPNQKGHYPILLFFHGGGWVTGNIDSYNKVCVHMAQITGHMVVSVDYALAPEHPFPAALEDCYAVAREIFLDTRLLDTPTDDITLIGDSAGANLAAALSLMARDRGEFTVAQQILIYPATYNDHSPHTRFDSVRENGTDYLLTAKRVSDYMELYAGGDPQKLNDPYFAPLLAADLSRQPRTLVITAQYDPLRDEGEAYARALRDAGNTVMLYRMPGALHGYFSLPMRFKLVRRTYDMIDHFLNGDSAHAG